MVEKSKKILSLEMAIEISDNLAKKYHSNREISEFLKINSGTLDSILQEEICSVNIDTDMLCKKLKELLKLSYNINVDYWKNGGEKPINISKEGYEDYLIRSKIEPNEFEKELKNYLETVDVLTLKVVLEIMRVGSSNDVDTEDTLISLFNDAYKKLNNYSKKFISVDIDEICGKGKDLYTYLKRGIEILKICKEYDL